MKVKLVDFAAVDSIPSVGLDERHGVGLRKRDRGNWWYAREDFTNAVHCYRKAVEYLDDEKIEADMEVPIDRFLLPKELQDLLEDRVKTLNNMAQVHTYTHWMMPPPPHSPISLAYFFTSSFHRLFVRSLLFNIFFLLFTTCRPR